MDAALVRRVWRRAGRRCEYCRTPQDYDDLPFEIDHIIPRKHGGLGVSGNLALSCFWCNCFKGSDLAGLDPRTGKLTPLFHPRRHKWARHFRWDGPVLRTVAVLRVNDPFRVGLRAWLIEEGLFPPSDHPAAPSD